MGTKFDIDRFIMNTSTNKLFLRNAAHEGKQLSFPSVSIIKMTDVDLHILDIV